MTKIFTKLLSVMVLAVFVLSILPVALAQNNNVKITEREIKLSPALENAPIGQVQEQVRNGIINVQVNMEKAQERYEEVKGKYLDAKEKYLEQKENLVQVRQRVQKCAQDVGECVQERLELKKGAVQHLLKTVEVMERSLEKLTERVESSEVLTAEEKEAVLTEIAELEAQLIAEKENLEALPEEASAEELKAAIQELKRTWQKISKEQKRIVARLTHSKLKQLVEKHHGLEQNMQARIDSLAERGVDVRELEEIRERFVVYDEQIREDFAVAKAEWQEAENKQEAWDAWREAQLKVREEMKESREILREFTRKFVELKQSLSDDIGEIDDDEDEREEDDENETDEDEVDDDEDGEE